MTPLAHLSVRAPKRFLAALLGGALVCLAALPAQADVKGQSGARGWQPEVLMSTERSRRLADLKCLAEAIYFEARGEPVDGQIGVAEVIVNRVRSGAYPDTVCDVVYQGANEGRVCQFSFACDGHPESPQNPAAWAFARELAQTILQGRVQPITSNATHFHATSVRPSWSRVLQRTITIGNHVFYRNQRRSDR